MECNSSHLKSCKSKISTQRDGVYNRGTPATLCNYKSHKWASHSADRTSAITTPLAHAAGFIYFLLIYNAQHLAIANAKSQHLWQISENRHKIFLICRRKIHWNLLDSLHYTFILHYTCFSNRITASIAHHTYYPKSMLKRQKPNQYKETLAKSYCGCECTLLFLRNGTFRALLICKMISDISLETCSYGKSSRQHNSRIGFKVEIQTCLWSVPFYIKNISYHFLFLLSFSVGNLGWGTCGFAHAYVLRTKYSEYLLCSREFPRSILLIWHN